MRRQLLAVAVAAAMLVPAVSYARRSRKPKIPPSTPRQFIQNIALTRLGATEITIVATEADKDRAEADLSTAMANASTSANQLVSDMDAINDAPRKTPVEVSDKLIAILNRCKNFSSLTKGGFDITNSGNWKKIKAKSSSNTVTLKNNDAQIDPSTFAVALKGFIVDDTLTELKSKGWTNVQVKIDNVTNNIGRDIWTPWKVRIGVGNERGKYAFRAFDYSVGDVASSKVSPSQFPSTENPPEVSNAIVFAQNAATAAAYSLAIYAFSVKNPEKGLKFIQTHPEVQGIIIARDGRMLTSTELSTKKNPETRD
jgi:thiamine biosynthesis lipoprotein ApbE